MIVVVVMSMDMAVVVVGRVWLVCMVRVMTVEMLLLRRSGHVGGQGGLLGTLNGGKI